MSKLESLDVDALMSTRRWCYTIPRESGFVEGRGWRVSIAIEGIKGHYPTGDLDFGKSSHVEPWFWGGVDDSYETAEQICAEQNQTLGFDVTEVWKIIMSTMNGDRRKNSPVFRRRQRKESR